MAQPVSPTFAQRTAPAAAAVVARAAQPQPQPAPAAAKPQAARPAAARPPATSAFGRRPSIVPADQGSAAKPEQAAKPEPAAVAQADPEPTGGKPTTPAPRRIGGGFAKR